MSLAWELAAMRIRIQLRREALGRPSKWTLEGIVARAVPRTRIPLWVRALRARGQRVDLRNLERNR